jgi:hypothetical protein
MTALVFAFKPTKGAQAVQDDPKEPYLLTAGAMALPTTVEVVALMESEAGCKEVHYKVGGGQHGTEATKEAIKEKFYLKKENNLMFVQTEIYAMGFLEMFLAMRVMDLLLSTCSNDGVKME